jgi:hypothetical protein
LACALRGGKHLWPVILLALLAAIPFAPDAIQTIALIGPALTTIGAIAGAYLIEHMIGGKWVDIRVRHILIVGLGIGAAILPLAIAQIVVSAALDGNPGSEIWPTAVNMTCGHIVGATIAIPLIFAWGHPNQANLSLFGVAHLILAVACTAAMTTVITIPFSDLVRASLPDTRSGALSDAHDDYRHRR